MNSFGVTTASTVSKNAAADGFPCYELFEKDPNLKPLRETARFRQFVAKLGAFMKALPDMVRCNPEARRSA